MLFNPEKERCDNLNEMLGTNVDLYITRDYIDNVRRWVLDISMSICEDNIVEKCKISHRVLEKYNNVISFTRWNFENYKIKFPDYLKLNKYVDDIFERFYYNTLTVEDCRNIMRDLLIEVDDNES